MFQRTKVTEFVEKVPGALPSPPRWPVRSAAFARPQSVVSVPRGSLRLISAVLAHAVLGVVVDKSFTLTTDGTTWIFSLSVSGTY